MLQKLLSILLSLRKGTKDLFPGTQYPIIEAFELDGHKYYQFDNTTAVPYERALKTLTYYKELRQGVDGEYLDKHTEAQDAIFASGQATHEAMSKLHSLNENLKARRKFIIDTDLVYKLASVVYFDEHENPKVYDMAYNQKKIEFWKSKLSINDFFYSAPILNLIPFLKDSKLNLDQYSKVVALAKTEHLNRIDQILNRKGASSKK